MYVLCMKGYSILLYYMYFQNTSKSKSINIFTQLHHMHNQYGGVLDKEKSDIISSRFTPNKC